MHWQNALQACNVLSYVLLTFSFQILVENILKMNKKNDKKLNIFDVNED